MKELLALAALLLPASALAGPLKGDLLGISGVLIGDSPTKVVARLGHPKSEEHPGDFVSIVYRYRGFSVGFDDRVVVDLESTTPAACTTEGLCPGDRVAKMKQLYGEPEVAKREFGTFYEYYTPDSTCWYQIASRSGRVSSVRVACQP